MECAEKNQLGVARVIKLGGDTILVAQVNIDAPDGEYIIDLIKTTFVGPAGAGECTVAIGID